MVVVVKWVDEEGMRGEGLSGEKGAFLGWICRHSRLASVLQSNSVGGQIFIT